MSIEFIAPNGSQPAYVAESVFSEQEIQPNYAPASAVGFSLSTAARLLATAEFVAVLVCAVIAKAVYLDYFLNTSEPLRPFFFVALCLGIAVYLVFKQMGLYEVERLAGPQIFFGKLLGGLIIALLSVLGFMYAIKMVGGISRGWIFVWLTLTTLCVFAVRLEVVRRVKRGLRSGLLLQRIAIVGTKDFALALARRIRKAEGPSRAIDLYHCPTSGSEDIRFVGDLGMLETAIADRQYDRVVVAIPDSEIEAIQTTVRSLGTYTTDLLLCTDLTHSPISTTSRRHLPGIRADVIHLVPRSEQFALLKRTLDVLVAGSLLLLLSPLFLMVALAIKLDSGGSVIFKQRRLGQNSTPFWIYKFRSMTVAENGPTIVQAKRRDERVTRVGWFIRRTSIDELPQLMNVLLGQMSLVGPRPHAIAHDIEFDQSFDLFSRRRRVKPGITGWAQVNGFRGETRTLDDVRGRMEHDLYYIDNWSIWLDIEIIVRTLLVAARGAY